MPTRNPGKWRQHRRSGQHNEDQFCVGRELDTGHDPRCPRHRAASPRLASPREGPPRAARPSEVRRARLAEHLHHRAVPCSQLKEVGEVLGHLRWRPLHLRARPRPRAVRRASGCLPQPRPRAGRAARGGAVRTQSLSSLSAPASSRAWTTSTWPFLAAPAPARTQRRRRQAASPRRRSGARLPRGVDRRAQACPISTG